MPEVTQKEVLRMRDLLMKANEPVLDLFIPAVPVAQPRPRASILKLKDGSQRAMMHDAPSKGKNAHPVHRFKGILHHAVSQAWGERSALQGAVEVLLMFSMPRPKSMTWKRRKMRRDFHTKKPDLDNLEKAVLDSLTGLVWADDDQVCSVTKSKLYIGENDQVGVHLRVFDLEG